MSDSTSSARTSSEPTGMGSGEALLLCQRAVRMVAKDPERAEVPAVQNFGKGNEHYFAWGASTRMARMRNGLGLEVAVSASCTVDRTTRKITTLTVNGETII